MQEVNFFSKRNANIIKGLAIILMVIHHVFGFPERINGIEYIPMVWNIEKYIADFGRICVFMYLFLSGYGLCNYTLKNENPTYKSMVSRIIKLLKIYWIVMIIFIPMGALMGIYTFNIKEFIMNFLTLSYSYNGEWWFINTYIILIFTFPFIHKIIKDKKNINIICTSLIIHLIATGIYFIVPKVDSILIVKILRLALIYQLYFIIGYVFCRDKIFDNINKYVISKKLDKLLIQLIVLLVCIMIRRISSLSDFIIGPITIYSSLIIISKLKVDKIFEYMSKHSTNIWLTHSFFCYYYFKQIVFMPKYALLIILWIFILCILTSSILDKVTNIKLKINIKNHHGAN